MTIGPSKTFKVFAQDIPRQSSHNPTLANFFYSHRCNNKPASEHRWDFTANAVFGRSHELMDPLVLQSNYQHALETLIQPPTTHDNTQFLLQWPNLPRCTTNRAQTPPPVHQKPPSTTVISPSSTICKRSASYLPPNCHLSVKNYSRHKPPSPRVDSQTCTLATHHPGAYHRLC